MHKFMYIPETGCVVVVDGVSKAASSVEVGAAASYKAHVMICTFYT